MVEYRCAVKKLRDATKGAAVTKEEIANIEKFYHQTMHRSMLGGVEESLRKLEESMSKGFLNLKQEITNMKQEVTNVKQEITNTLRNMEERSLPRLANAQAKAVHPTIEAPCNHNGQYPSQAAPPIYFTATLSELHKMNGNEVNQLLVFYKLSIEGSVENRKEAQAPY